MTIPNINPGTITVGTEGSNLVDIHQVNYQNIIGEPGLPGTVDSFKFTGGSQANTLQTFNPTSYVTFYPGASGNYAINQEGHATAFVDSHTRNSINGFEQAKLASASHIDALEEGPKNLDIELTDPNFTLATRVEEGNWSFRSKDGQQKNENMIKLSFNGHNPHEVSSIRFPKKDIENLSISFLHKGHPIPHAQNLTYHQVVENYLSRQSHHV